jgi:hypothetical protein
MRRHLLVPLAVLAATLVPTAAAAQASSADRVHGRCDPQHHVIHLAHGAITGLKTIRETPRVWIARTRRDFGAEFFACWKPTHRARRIAFNSGGAAVTDASVDSVTLNGRYVAFHVGAAGDENYDRFESFDASTLRLRRDTGKVAATPPAARQTALAVTSTGALGWVAASTLHATDAAGTRALALATGGAITGVRAHGRKLLWVQASRQMSAALT